MSPLGLSALESACVSQNIAFAGLSSLTLNVKEPVVSVDIRCCAGIEVKEIRLGVGAKHAVWSEW